MLDPHPSPEPPIEPAPSQDAPRSEAPPIDPATSHVPPPPAPPPPASSHDERVDPDRLVKIRWWIVLPVLAVGAFALHRLREIGLAPRKEHAEALAAERAAYEPRPSVETVRPRKGDTTFDLRLPADVASMQETAIYSRASGYLAEVLVDIGDRVRAEQPLARIATPEIDAQIVAARAAVTLADANVAKVKVDVALAESTLRRFEGLALSGGAIAQEVDEKRSSVAQSKAALTAAEASVLLAQAEVKRLGTLQEFERVAAPFAGVVTARGYDVGALVGPSGPSAGTPLFRIERGDRLRVWVDLPQTYVASATKDAKAWLSVRNYPGKEVVCTLARTAGVLDPTSRTLRCQFEVPNPDGALASGMFGELRFPVTRPQVLTVPTTAPTFGASGPTIWVVEGKKVLARSVKLGRDYGTEIEVTEGLRPEDEIVRNAGERLLDGIEVIVLPPAKPAAAPAPK